VIAPSEHKPSQHEAQAAAPLPTLAVPGRAQPWRLLAAAGAIVDTAVADWQTLVAGIRPGAEVVVLDGKSDGLGQIAVRAEGKSGYDAIHVLSHGAEGQVRLGMETLNNAAFSTYAAGLVPSSRNTEHGKKLAFHRD